MNVFPGFISCKVFSEKTCFLEVTKVKFSPHKATILCHHLLLSLTASTTDFDWIFFQNLLIINKTTSNNNEIYIITGF